MRTRTGQPAVTSKLLSHISHNDTRTGRPALSFKLLSHISHNDMRTGRPALSSIRFKLARALYKRCIYGIFGREMTKYLFIYGVYGIYSSGKP